MSESTIVITKLINTCSACPSQWYAWDASGQKYYIRFRWGNFEMVTVAGEELSPADTMGRNLVEYCSNNGYDGSMDFERLKEVTGKYVSFVKKRLIQLVELLLTNTKFHDNKPDVIVENDRD